MNVTRCDDATHHPRRVSLLTSFTEFAPTACYLPSVHASVSARLTGFRIEAPGFAIQLKAQFSAAPAKHVVTPLLRWPFLMTGHLNRDRRVFHGFAQALPIHHG